LFVGQSPGYNEDQKGEIFIGYTGKLLDRFVTAAKLTNYADVYVTNAVRCLPPQAADETQSQIRACRKHLIADIALLQAYYDEVILVALGAKACYSVANISSLNEGFKKQAMQTTLTFLIKPKPCVFFTNHPAILHPTRQPAKVYVVESHFRLLLRYLQGNFIPNSLNIKPEVGVPVPTWFSRKISIDIETYGILAGKEQTVFNPHKSKYIDKVDYPNQIVTVSFAWRDIAGKLHTALYEWDNPSHRVIIRKWFRVISTQHHILLGQFIKYDLTYLSVSGDKELQYWIQPERIMLDDTLLLSFLYYEQQPEKALKELCTLYGISDYSGLKVTGKSGNAKSSKDKDLHYYNALDSGSTFVLGEQLEQMILDKYGKDSFKLSRVCQQMRNAVIWDIFDLELNGSALSIKRLEELHSKEESRCKEIEKECVSESGIKVAGRGSDGPLREFIQKCADKAGLLNDSRLECTKKANKISIGVENVNLIMGYLPECKERITLSLFQEYKERAKIVNTYTRPLLEEPRRGITLRRGNIGLVYPSWYPIPSYNERGGGSDEKQKGQIQGRFSCTKPARLTEPPMVRDLSISRWPGGKLVEYDVNQDHLRMAALLSGDPELMGAYHKKGGNIHLQTAAAIFPDIYSSAFKKEHPKEYTLCKSLNFLILFKGGATAFQREARESVGIELPIEFCHNAIRRWYNKYHTYGEWQKCMIALATKQGYLELPTGWSRTFGPPGMALGAYEGEVLNFLHQCPCAQITQSSHYKILTQFRAQYLHSKICLQIYDAIFVDIFPGEEEITDSIVGEAMTYPPLLPVYENWIGRSVPWSYEKKKYQNG